MNFVIRAIALPVCALSVVGLVACNDSSETAQNETQPPTETVNSPESSPTSDPEPSLSDEDRYQISENGIGVAQLGMTIGELKQALGETAEFEVKSPFIVDFDAIAVRQDGEVQFYILYLAGEPATDEDPIQGLWTDNPKYKTAEGVGPGTLISAAEEAYGDATLSFNYDNEGREYVRFADLATPNLSFGTGNASLSTAGIYENSGGGFNETQDYNADATIQSVLVVCLAEGC